MVDGQSGDKILAVIPARGGSKRLPKKNIIDFMGKPMIVWTIEAAMNAKIFDAVLVSTDDEEIAEISRAAGAVVPFLREKAADDFSPVSEATISALHQMEVWSGIQYDTIVQLMANCPLRGSSTIINQLKNFNIDPNRKSLLSGFAYGMANPWWAHKINDDESVTPVFPEYLKGQRSQDLPKLICPTGAIWISSAKNLKNYNTFYSSDYSFYPISWIDAVDIDDQEDLLFAKAAFKIKYEKSD